jgi:hypothetical protein
MALALALGAFVVWGPGTAGTVAALRLTARLAFLFFWSSYVGGALVTLFGQRFQPLRRRARAFGLAFGAVLAVHLGLVSWSCWIGDTPSLQTFAIFGLGAAWVLLLVVSSIDRVGHALGDTGWWVLRNIGMNYIAFAFALDFLGFQHPATLLKASYLPFALLSLLGPLIKLIAWLRRQLAAGGARRDTAGYVVPDADARRGQKLPP